MLPFAILGNTAATWLSQLATHSSLPLASIEIPTGPFILVAGPFSTRTGGASPRRPLAEKSTERSPRLRTTTSPAPAPRDLPRGGLTWSRGPYTLLAPRPAP